MSSSAIVTSAGGQKFYYGADFFDEIRSGSLRSARRILPLVLELIKPESVVDVGCGVGTWLSAARELGVSDVLGLDGDYVDIAKLQIAPGEFRTADLSKPFEVERSFDLAMSLEVAEHLPSASAESFVSCLCRLSKAVLFSAAIPNQGGTNHINEQWQDYWIKLFETHDFVKVDCIRSRVWEDPEVEWWYAQNTFLMVHEEALSHSPRLVVELETSKTPIRMVHPRSWDLHFLSLKAQAQKGIRGWLGDAPAAGRSTLANLKRRFSFPRG